jgi:hypothetical protein
MSCTLRQDGTHCSCSMSELEPTLILHASTGSFPLQASHHNMCQSSCPILDWPLCLDQPVLQAGVAASAGGNLVGRIPDIRMHPYVEYCTMQINYNTWKQSGLEADKPRIIHSCLLGRYPLTPSVTVQATCWTPTRRTAARAGIHTASLGTAAASGTLMPSSLLKVLLRACSVCA